MMLYQPSPVDVVFIDFMLTDVGVSDSSSMM
jgi:hypothetical protein